MDVTDVVGGYGPWQRTILLVIIYRAFPLAMTGMTPLFYIATTDHWCARPAGLNWTVDEWRQMATPLEEKGYSHCYQYHVFSNDTDDVVVDMNRTVPCEAWEYDSEYGNTPYKEFNLVCDSSWMAALTHTVLKLGNMVAFLPGGYLTDKFGRKVIALVGVGMSLICNTAAAFSPTYTAYLITRAFTGLAYGLIVTSSLCLLLEVLGPSHRHKVSYSFIGGWGIAISLLPGLYWLSQEWRHVQLITTIPFTVTLMMAIWWLVPESTRWLLVTNKDKKAEEIIRDAAKKNKVQIQDMEFTMRELKKKVLDESGNVVSSSILDLFKTRHMIKCTAVLLSSYFISAFVYFGFTLTVQALGASLYLTVFLMGATELLAVPFFTPIALYCRRRFTLVALNLFSAAAFLAAIPVPQDMLWLRLTLAMAGRMTNICAGNLMWMIAAEIFPTTHRSLGINCCMTAGRVGTIFATFLVAVAYDRGQLLLVMFGVLVGLKGFLFLLLPETKGRHLPDTLESANKMSQAQEISNNAKQDKVEDNITLQQVKPI